MINLDELPGAHRYLYRNAGIPKPFQGRELRDLDLTGYDPSDIADLRRWRKMVSSGKVIGAAGVGLLLAGRPGHGKSALSCALANSVLLNTSMAIYRTAFPSSVEYIPFRPVYFTSWSDLLSVKRSLMDEDPNSEHGIKLSQIDEGVVGNYGDPAWNISLLVLDDVGREHTTDSGWNKRMLADLLRARWNKALPTIITTNLSLGDTDEYGIADAYGPATASLVNEACIYLPLHNDHGDLRKPAQVPR